MDLTTIIGFTGGLILVLSSVILRGGMAALSGFINMPSMMITFGGTFAALLINYPMQQVVKSFKIVQKIFTEKQEVPAHYIEIFRKLIIKSSKEGVLALQDELKEIDNVFLKRGVKMVIDGQSQDLIREELETELVFTRERHKIGQEIFITLGTYSPSFGMIGTIMGLILMLANLQNQAQIASGMAVALLTTFYGALAAYLIFLPVAGKLKRRSEEELFIKRVILRGVLSLHAGEIPSIAVSKLRAYIPRSAFIETAGKKSAKKEAASPAKGSAKTKKKKVKFKKK
ncbi:MAG: MotA/TolQ/ExbB proton channel family protein [Elusimicrobiota bacterium]|nr:MotA/TolQ/ExbB proton channel family protein [Elusimicrobiota bacterium]